MKAPTILYIQCGNAGTAYWRLYSWAEAIYRNGKGYTQVLGWDKNELYGAPWQFQIGDPQHQPRLFGMLYSAGQQADIIVFQRVETDWALTTFYAMRDQFPGKPILSEIDDDITDIAAYNQASEVIKPGSEPTRLALAQFRNSDGLIVTTPYLAEVYAEYCPHIYVVPNSIDFKRWGKVQRKKKPGIRIGWVGGATHVEDLRLLESVIPAVTAKNKDVRFVFVSSAIPDFIKSLPGVEVVEKWAPILKYPQHIGNQDFDIGVAPLRDNKFNRAKSNLRWLEYSALGIPTVASKVGHFAETIKDGEDGLLAETPADFVRHLDSLVADAKTRKALGQAAKRRVEADFNVDKNLDLYLDAVDDCLARPALSAPTTLTGVDDMKAEAELVNTPGIEFGPLEVHVE